MRTKAQVRRRCERLVANLYLPEPFELEVLRENLAEQQGRPLTFHPLPRPTAPGLPSGMWLATNHADHIFYDSQTSPLHQRHIIFHEIGHILLNHNAEGLVDNALFYESTGTLSPTLVRRMLGRIHYSTQEEQEAELTATLLLEAIEETSNESRAGFLVQFGHTLGYPGYR